MINFNELPCDVLDLIFKHNRSWTSKEISKYKSVFNEMINELNGLNRRKRLKENRRRSRKQMWQGHVCALCGVRQHLNGDNVLMVYHNCFPLASDTESSDEELVWF